MKTNKLYNSYDVCILGGGLAGLGLARQISLEHPKWNVVVLEKAEKVSSWKVGEATVELGAHYFMRKLSLTNYLYREHLPKNGLRFFFDNKDKNLELTQMSEVGSQGLPVHASFLVDRIKFEDDLITMVRKDGITVHQGAAVKEIQISEDESPHTISYVQGDEKIHINAKWLIDGTGRKKLVHSLCGQTLNLKQETDTRLNTTSVWGRFSHIKDIDYTSQDPIYKKFRERVYHNTRMMGALHFMYEGYWVWFIPLDKEVFSIGVVYDKDVSDLKLNKKNFTEFLKSHNAINDLMSESKMLDFLGYPSLPYKSNQYFFKNRVTLIGESSAFEDPFYSPGTDFIALSTDLTIGLIKQDFENNPDFHESIELYNEFYKDRYERTMRLYIDQYKYFGSCTLMKEKYELDLKNYYNLFYWPFIADKHLDKDWLRVTLKEKNISKRVAEWQKSMLDQAYEMAMDKDQYYKENEGTFSNTSKIVKELYGLLEKDYCKNTSDKFLERTSVHFFLNLISDLEDNSQFKEFNLLKEKIDFLTLLTQFKKLTPESIKDLTTQMEKALTKVLKQRYNQDYAISCTAQGIQSIMIEGHDQQKPLYDLANALLRNGEDFLKRC